MLNISSLRCLDQDKGVSFDAKCLILESWGTDSSMGKCAQDECKRCAQAGCGCRRLGLLLAVVAGDLDC